MPSPETLQEVKHELLCLGFKLRFPIPFQTEKTLQNIFEYMCLYVAMNAIIYAYIYFHMYVSRGRYKVKFNGVWQI